jgi:hypothetical protein
MAAEEFDELRPSAFAIAYRMLGSVSEAEDVVQEGFLRLHRAREGGERIESPRAYLSTVVSRLSLDHLRSARVRRETYVGEWLPEPLVASAEDDPARKAEMADSLSLAWCRCPGTTLGRASGRTAQSAATAFCWYAGLSPPARTSTGMSTGAKRSGAGPAPPPDAGTATGHGGDPARIVVPATDATPPTATVALATASDGRMLAEASQPGGGTHSATVELSESRVRGTTIGEDSDGASRGSASRWQRESPAKAATAAASSGFVPATSCRPRSSGSVLGLACASPPGSCARACWPLAATAAAQARVLWRSTASSGGRQSTATGWKLSRPTSGSSPDAD